MFSHSETFRNKLFCLKKITRENIILLKLAHVSKSEVLKLQYNMEVHTIRTTKIKRNKKGEGLQRTILFTMELF